MKSKHHVSTICTFALLAVTLMGTVPAANATSWSSFSPASFIDIYLEPQLATGQLDYVLSLGPSPKIQIGPQTYNVNWVQAYYVVSQDPWTGFEASNGTTVTDWTWGTKDKPGQIAGWQGTGQERLYPGQQKELGFATLDITGNAVLSGLHLGYNTVGAGIGCDECSGMFKCGLPAPDIVPEPGSMLAMMTGLVGSVWVVRRRTKR